MRRRKRRSASAGSIAIRTECLSWFAPHAVGQVARCFYYFFMILVVIRHKTKATARRALTFVVRIFVNDPIAIAVRTSFHVCGGLHRRAFLCGFCFTSLSGTRVSADNQSANSQCYSERFHQILPWLGGNGSSK